MDKRDCRRAPDRIVIDDDDGIERELPITWEACDVCDGKGTHVNPNIDRQGLTAEDFAEDPDFRGDYMSGMYDVSCNRCGGRKVVAVVDDAACDPVYLKIYRELQQAEYDDDAYAAAEARHFDRGL